MDEKQIKKLAQKLLDETFIQGYLSAKLKNQFPKAIFSQTKITPIKKEIGGRYYLVIRYNIKNLDRPIFCSASSSSDRKNAFNALKFICSKLPTTTPLFYSKQFRAMFYLGVPGKNLQEYIKEHPKKIKDIIILTAELIAKFHQIKINPEKHNFNHNNSDIETVTPGIKYSIGRLSEKAPENISQIKKLFEIINTFDKQNSSNKKYLIHGDFHPENIIIHNENPLEITIIDYTDICVSDFARDLGNFLHQLKYMTSRFNPTLAKNLPEFEKSFLNAYFKKVGIKPTPEIKKRIAFYSAWTALRNTIFFLIKKFKETEEAKKSINSAYKYLDNTK